MPSTSAAATHVHAGAARVLAPARHAPPAAMRPLRFGYAASNPTASLSLFARQAATTASRTSAAHPSYTDRHVIQSELKTMSAKQLLRFDNSSSITIWAIIAVVCAVGGVFLLCLLLAAILSWTNPPRHEAFPYAQLPAQAPLYQPSASVARNSGPKNASASDLDATLLDPAPSLAGGNTLHSRTGSSGLGFPGPARASRRGPAAAQYQSRAPSSSPDPPPVAPGTVNYNGREMTINMAGPEADAAARVAAESRLERERARRSTVIGGPPPLAANKRASRYHRTQAMPPSARTSIMGRKVANRISRQSSRSSFMSAQSLDARGGGNLSSRRRAVTSTGTGMVRTASNQWKYEDGSSYHGRPHGGRHLSSVRHGAKASLHATESSIMMPADLGSMYDTTFVDDRRDPGWAAAQPSQINLLDPLQVHGPSPFVSALG